MNTDERLGTFEGILEPVPDEIGEIARAARALVVELDPDTYEVPRVKERSATYGVGPGKMKHGYCYIMPTNNHVNLGFFQGASLDDPAGLLEGTGKRMRHVKLRERATLDRPEIRALLVQAIEERAPFRG